MLIEGFNYKLYKEFIKVFSNVSNIYEVSKDIKLFQSKIYSNHILIPNYIYSKIVSQELKNKTDVIYSNLLKQNISIVTINSNKYPKKLFNTYNPPFVIFEYGKVLSNINDKKIIYLYDENLSKFGKKVYKYFNYYIKDKMLKIGSDDDNDILVRYENILNEKYINTQEKSRIIIAKENSRLEVILGLSDYLLIIEAMYNSDTKNMVEGVMEQGKEILVVPGNIFSKNHYFSNYLIQEGATVLLNKRDLDKFL